MTTTPRAKKFRIRRSTPLASDLRRTSPQAPEPSRQPESLRRAGPAVADAKLFDDDADDGFGDRLYPTAAGQTVSEPDEVASENAIAEIRKEGLTGRQLRMARRVAQRHGLAATSDFDAVRLLRQKGLDPFDRSSMLELVVPDQLPAKEVEYGVPQTVSKPQLPSTEVRPANADTRAREILDMQRSIVKRRRRKLAQLFSRLVFFVLLPTALAGYYYFKIATPMYATKSEFVIQQAESMAAGQLGGLFSGTSFATAADSISVQGYLQSVDAMLRLDADVGFRAHFSQPSIDPLQRLDPGATKDKAYKIFRKHVKISYDPTEGIIKMEVSAADPAVSQMFSERLIAYAEERVDNLTRRLRADQMKGARESFEQAESKMIEAQGRVLDLQERMGVLDPMTESQSLMAQVSNFETQLQQKRLQLQQLLDNARPNRARVEGAQGDIRRLEDLIATLRAQMTQSGTNSVSLARISGELRLAETDMQTRQLMMTQALQQMESARIEANRQTRYLSLAVTPIAPDDPTYPRAFENTVLAFLIFAGIYLMFSLTASILREQVSS